MMQTRPLTWLGLAVIGLALSLLALTEPPATTPPRDPSAGAAATSPVGPPSPWPQAVQALRRGDRAAAQRLVEPLAAGGGEDALEARLVLGLWAADEREHGRCTELLQAAADPDGRFEDWRLLGLADCHAALDHLPAATAMLSRLLDSRPGSPLRVVAALRNADLAGRLGDRRGVAAMVSLGRREQFSPEQTEQLERAVWQVAVDSGDHGLQRQVARRLLVEMPILASRLQVIELFRRPSGAIEWLSFLTEEELRQRARSLLAVGISTGALDALDAVPSGRRDLEWHLLRVEALTLAQRGDEALTLAMRLTADSRSDRIRAELLRADAAFEAARTRPGRPTPNVERRDRARAAGREALTRVLELAGEAADHRDAAITAHRRLLALRLDEESAEPAIQLLRSLQRLAPTDESGARYLWRRGWDDFQRGDSAAALAYWSELRALYPAGSYSRPAGYWSARALEELGDDEQAKAAYRRIAAAGAEDFYRRHARRRLGGDAPPGSLADSDTRQPWPWDPALSRARWLSDRGLDEEALIELTGLAARVDRRAVDALQAVILARLDRRRDSIHAVSRAFPQLGTLEQDSAPEEALLLYYPTEFESIVRRFAAAQGVPAPLLFAMIRQESAFDPAAVSRSGARGLMQLMPATGRELAQRLRLGFSDGRLSDPEFNIQLGSRYFRQLLEMFDGNEELALAGYNGGPYRIRRLWREAGSRAELDRFVEGLALSETTRYVKRIVLFRHTYDRLIGGRA